MLMVFLFMRYVSMQYLWDVYVVFVFVHSVNNLMEPKWPLWVDLPLQGSLVVLKNIDILYARWMYLYSSKKKFSEVAVNLD